MAEEEIGYPEWVEEGEFPDIEITIGHAPDGVYRCLLSRCMQVSVRGKPNLVIHWTISSGPWEGEDIPDFYDLDRGLWRLKRLLGNLKLEARGFNKVKVRDLPSLLEGILADVEITWDEEFQRYRVVSAFPVEE